MAIAAAVLLMALHHWFPLVVGAALLGILALFLHLGRPWLQLLKSLGFPVFSFFVIAWLAFDLVTGIVACLRLLTLSTVFFLFFQTTSPEILSNGLIKIGVPYSFAFVLSASMQFVHILVSRAGNIRDAQRSRGIPLDRGIGWLRHFPAIAGPLLIQAFKLADELAEAMEARGFGAPGRRFRHDLCFRWVDWFVAGISLTVVTIALFWS
jgi:energy-coupling factor transport system permease protein